MRRLILILILLAALAGGGYAAWAATRPAQPPTPAAPVLPPVQAREAVVAEAVVVPVESAELSLPTGGIVEQVVVEEGQDVLAGQTLLRLEAAAQRAAVAQAEAQLARAEAALAKLRAGARPEEIAQARAALAAAEANLERLKTSPRPQEVAVSQAALRTAEAELAQVEAGPDESEIIQARTAMQKAARTLQRAQADYDRAAGFDPAGIGARPEAVALEQATLDYEGARARYDALAGGPRQAEIAVARARVEQARASLAQALAGPHPSDIAAAGAEVDRARAQLDLLLAGPLPQDVAAAEADVAAARAVIQEAEATLARTELRAPSTGTVARLETSPGEHLTPGQPVVTLARLGSWRVETTDLTELRVVEVRPGDRARITFDALPDLEVGGTVERIRPLGENRQGDIVYTVVVIPDELPGEVRWNMTAVVEIE